LVAAKTRSDFRAGKGRVSRSEKDFFDFVHEDDREEIWGRDHRAVDERRE
jgi:hypothetical protein